MVPRMGSRGWADAGHCSLSPQTAKAEKGQGQIWVDNLENTLRRSRGDIVRYQATPGAPLAAARVSRRPWTAPTTIPGAGRGLKVFDSKFHHSYIVIDNRGW